MICSKFPTNWGCPMAARSTFAEARAFLAVVELKSFAKAATHLALSRPRVSELVRNLEENLGVRLVERTTRSVAPTPAGDRLVERLRPALEQYEAALESTNEFRGKLAGTLRLSVAPPAADLVLADAIPRFLALYPDIKLDMSIDAGFIDIVSGRFDAGIRNGRYLARDMIAVRISGEMPLVVVAAPAYLASRGKPDTPQDLASHDCLRLRLPNGGAFPWRFRRRRRTLQVHVDGPLIANEGKILIRAAINGAGLVQLPRQYVELELAAGRLVSVLEDWAPPWIDGFFIYYSKRRQSSPALKALVEFFRDPRQRAGMERGIRKVTPIAIADGRREAKVNTRSS